MKKFMFPMVLCLAMSLSLEVSPSFSSEVERLFWERRWDELASVTSEDLSPREISMVANGLWTKGRWEDALALMDEVGDRYPEEIRPYASMLRVLALERIGDPKAAYGEALDLYLSSPPEDLTYYVCYALSRLTGNEEERRKWMRRMLSATDDSTLKAKTLDDLMDFPDPSLSDASAALRIRPLNSRALKLFEKASPSRERSYRLGYAAYLREDHDKAVKYLAQVPLSGSFSQSALYYRAMALYRLKRYGEALPLLSRLIIMDNSDYVVRGSRRIALIAKRGHMEEAEKVLFRASRELSGDRALSAAVSYAGILSGESKTDEEDRILKLYPRSSEASSILWNRAWVRWDKGDYEGALSFFEKASSSKGMAPAEHLYWKGRCLERLNRPDEAIKSFKALSENYPLSIYSYLAFPGDPVSMVPGAGKLERRESELERWGFVIHAKMRLSGSSDPQKRYNGAWLAAWMGNEDEAFRAARSLASYAVGPDGVYRDLAKFLYPRPYREVVEEMANRFQVEPAVIWSIMKQESAFNPSAVSWVGASGLMQLMPRTAKWEADTLKMGKYDLFSVKDNVTLGTAHISRLLRSYRRLEWSLAAYNAGSGNVNKWNRSFGDRPMDLWMEEIPFTETRGYVKKVMGNLFVYRQLYGETDK
ncbi:transglycosylase SLT domain-containing protein [Dethiosulfovibrio sp. F2B]|uniref:transglycosylase SLT domain-containing protein n=1 Tax=Dethiosulfovibrio faecalis TaxID=2720018 RepID=UPI001F48BAC5|nr:transglycosylase SLT domain-containing protein [Dethiosulfovibrio faecalis]MCF4151713.1 transglycosylase SLT domain-containing protein [Dethiosulfovibrio faecalis]